uniref:DUF983 domain-containing protein n=1 Tax=Flavobacterium sp. TaxID=239 RepID=UPI00286E871A
MLKKGSTFYSILTGSCPRCNEESMYKGKNLYNPSETIKLNPKCSHCGLHYNIEPSFFYGSMYVSYGLGVLVGVAVFLICYFVFKTNLKTCFITILISLTVLMPFIMRLSRNIWINLNIGFDKDWRKKV